MPAGDCLPIRSFFVSKRSETARLKAEQSSMAEKSGQCPQKVAYLSIFCFMIRKKDWREAIFHEKQAV